MKTIALQTKLYGLKSPLNKMRALCPLTVVLQGFWSKQFWSKFWLKISFYKITSEVANWISLIRENLNNYFYFFNCQEPKGAWEYNSKQANKQKNMTLCCI